MRPFVGDIGTVIELRMMRPFVGDIGTVIELRIGTNITGATNLKMFCRKPKVDGSGYEIKTWTTGVYIYGSANLCYVTIQNDFDVPGVYRVQGYLELSDGWKGRTEVAEFEVLPVLTAVES
jgi:hypothetical protein